MKNLEQHYQTPALWAVILIGMAGTAMFNLAPLFLPAAAVQFDIADRQLGWLTGAEVLGIALASLAVMLHARRQNPEHLAMIGASVILLGNLATSSAHDFTSLLAMRFIVGFLGDGLAYASAVLMLGRQPNPVRAFAFFSFSNMCFTGLALVALPRVPGGTHWDSMLGIFALLGALAMLATRSLPTQAPASPSRDTKPIPWKIGGGALLGLFAFTANLGAVWGFAENIGIGKGLRTEQIGLYLSISIGFQALGSLAAAHLEDAWTGQRSFIITLALQLIGLALLNNLQGAWGYALGIALWGFSWNFGLANILGSLSRLPASDRLLPLAPGTEALGAAFGPVLAGVLGIGTLTNSVTLVASAGAVLAWLSFLVTGLMASHQVSGITKI